MSSKVLLVQGSAFEHAQLKTRSQNDAPPLLCKVITAPHPRTSEPVKWLLEGNRVLELQIARPEATSFNSFFVEQRVQSDGILYTASAVDPTFFLLPLLAKRQSTWVPLDQMLCEAQLPWLLACGACAAAASICDINDQLGPQTVLCRLNEAKTVALLQAKVERVRTCLERIGSAVQTQAGMIAGFTGQSGDDAHEAAQEAVQRQSEHLQTALELTCDYLPQEWAEKLTAKYEKEYSSLYEARGAKRKAAAPAWEADAEEDRNMALSHTSANSNNTKKKVVATKTTSKLAKINTKGMKSIASMFGAPKKK